MPVVTVVVVRVHVVRIEIEIVRVVRVVRIERRRPAVAVGTVIVQVVVVAIARGGQTVKWQPSGPGRWDARPGGVFPTATAARTGCIFTESTAFTAGVLHCTGTPMLVLSAGCSPRRQVVLIYYPSFQ